MRIAVIGASGFVGSTVTERLVADGHEVLPIIHSTGNAWRLTRAGLKPRVLDILDGARVGEALAGVTHVVNCSRGDDNVMLRGLDNLLGACRRLELGKFVHLSSVAVYGDPPPASATSEDAPTHPAPGTYGAIKLQQDTMVAKAARRGLPAVILCPPNIIGPQSDYLLQLLTSLIGGRFALLDDGSAVCNTVDVTNLAHAVALALTAPARGGERFFITDEERVSWLAITDALRAAAGLGTPVPRISADELHRLAALPAAPRASLGRAMKHLVSGDVRQALRKDPLLAKVDGFFRGLAASLGSGIEGRLRHAVEGPLKVTPEKSGPSLNARLCAQQLRGVWHSSERARRELGYRAPYGFADSMHAFAHWLRATRGMDEQEEWRLVRALYGYGH